MTIYKPTEKKYNHIKINMERMYAVRMYWIY